MTASSVELRVDGARRDRKIEITLYCV